jgi:hypothetical protein
MATTTKKSVSVHEKMNLAKETINKMGLKKTGHNSYSNYDYFEPEVISGAVLKACIKHGLLTKFDMYSDGDFLRAELIIFRVDNPEDKLIYTMPTIAPNIKATNSAQKVGGAATYAERYLKMSAFDIADNSLDFDATHNAPKVKTPITQNPNFNAQGSAQVDYTLTPNPPAPVLETGSTPGMPQDAPVTPPAPQTPAQNQVGSFTDKPLVNDRDDLWKQIADAISGGKVKTIKEIKEFYELSPEAESTLDFLIDLNG